ncbi:MAG: T9SS type A sorting domain-containing protein [Bacteroidetes bacterium]|nr:T9SS type A sorting domain-containing protein [Bacteroidota bacterium]
MHVDESGATLNIPAANDNGSSVRLYPNPVTETIHIMVSATAIDAQLVVYDISGKKVIHIDNIYSQMIDISATELTSGLYFYSFINKNDATAPLNGTFEVLK